MKQRLFNVLFLTVFQGILFSTTAMAIPLANLNLVNSPSAVGDTFQVEVRADGDGMGAELLSFGFDVTFNNGGIFNYNGYTLGAGFDDDSLFAPVDVAGSAFPGIMDNDVLLATLSFTTLAIGTDTLNVTGLYDAMFSGLYYELTGPDLNGYDINKSLMITAGSSSPVIPTPEPATLILFGTGIAGLAGTLLKRKKH
jgi:hypothetical protein